MFIHIVYYLETDMKVSRKDMANQQVPIHSRDYCAHKLIPLNT